MKYVSKTSCVPRYADEDEKHTAYHALASRLAKEIVTVAENCGDAYDLLRAVRAHIDKDMAMVPRE